ncbi:MAG: DUF3108 domain-containing protein [gamma proteobacterium symbiont of Bathyaustriella thionipta]|nr:DUF3108 domain-containing protein [gamma proteobacterium symbiont of Bathyaustriella thionipta]MCU7949915.1 DUF3108 domain-containing protein [gamma proteobacterium symbiont of Bathyaustriella thionipta]MCU7953467.1 DUF3108 domain-containing protein [gamma proteobacterium symbiont of Bathyaustriella thionipta]MCU7955584.1 DUF3108 domain-containing protein [gamma proteobacterium symbiont of Bathyaustriella thionipta]MCU7965884.1 DUF3108 domain-containing protein [gamma proteobacterium symbion
MIWADLADIKMTFSADKITPDKQNAHQFELYLTTENYTKAEMFQPVRYTYKTTLDSHLRRTVLVEETDVGSDQSHDFLWLDWKNKTTQLFKKREKIQQHSGFLGMNVKEVWEEDGTHRIPAFLKHFPLLEMQQTYIIHKESGDKIRYPKILDPLSLIYTIRTLDDTMDSNTLKEIPVAVSDDIRLYKIQKQSLESFSLNGKKVQGTKYKIQTNEKKDNYYYVWISNDEYRIPLRMAMDAPLGKLEIDLVKLIR